MKDPVDRRIDALIDSLYLIRDDITNLQHSQKETDRQFSNLLRKFEEIGLVQGEFGQKGNTIALHNTPWFVPKAF